MYLPTWSGYGGIAGVPGFGRTEGAYASPLYSRPVSDPAHPLSTLPIRANGNAGEDVDAVSMIVDFGAVALTS